MTHYTKINKIISLSLSIVIIFNIFFIYSEKTVCAGSVINNPRISSSGITTWDCIYFGNYWQSSSSKKDRIKWRVLSVNGNDAFLLSDKILDFKSFDDGWGGTSWAKCTLRNWLNNDFYNNAFSATERNAIITTTVSNPANPQTGAKGCENTYDKIYIPSVYEVVNPRYGFSTQNGKSSTRVARLSDYVLNKQDSSTSYEGWWTLRTMGDDTNVEGENLYFYSAQVLEDGGVFYFGLDIVGPGGHLIRPCLHIDLSKSVWTSAGKVDSNGNISNYEEYYEDTSYYTSTNNVCSRSILTKVTGNVECRDYVNSIASIKMVIPGIKQTNQGNNSKCCNMVPQGICSTNDYILLSAYCHDKIHKPVIYVLDKRSSKYLTTILLSVEGGVGLNTTNHVGGLAFHDNYVYIAGSSDKKVWKLSYNEVLNAVYSRKDCYEVKIQKGDSFDTGKASYISWDESFQKFFVGYFDTENYKDFYMNAYDGDGKPSSEKIQLPLFTQGVGVGVYKNNTYCICSCSYGKDNPSAIYVAKLNKLDNSCGYILSNWKKIQAPNMSEDIQVDGGIMYNCYESAANCYNIGGVRETAFDRIPCIYVDSLISSTLKNGKNVSLNKRSINKSSLLLNSTVDLLGSEQEDEDLIIENNGNIVSYGSCGENTNYCLYDDGTMIISGQGNMYDYSIGSTPWELYRDNIKSVFIDMGVSSIGEYAFYGCDNLNELTISEFMNPELELTIKENAFSNCTKLEKISLPKMSYGIADSAFDADDKLLFESNASDIREFVSENDNYEIHTHDYKYKCTVDATCMEDGYDLYECSCGEEVVKNVKEATCEHDFIEKERVEAVEGEDGYILYECKNCPNSYVETLEYNSSMEGNDEVGTKPDADIKEPTSSPTKIPTPTPADLNNTESGEVSLVTPTVTPTANSTGAPTVSPIVTPTVSPTVVPSPAAVKDKVTTFSIKNKAKIKKTAKIKVKDKDKIKKITLNGKNVKIKKNKTSITIKLKSYKKALKKKGKWNTLKVTDNKGNVKSIKFKTK